MLRYVISLSLFWMATTAAPPKLQPFSGASAGAAIRTSSWMTTNTDITTLVPTLAPSHNSSDLSHLSPKEIASIYYHGNTAPEASAGRLAALVEANFTATSVVLDHSEYISDVSCATDGLSITFTTPDALRHARDEWKSATPFVAVTSTVTCGSAPDGQHTFWTVTGANFTEGSLSARLDAEETSIEKAAAGAKISWGTALSSTGAPNSQRRSRAPIADMERRASNVSMATDSTANETTAADGSHAITFDLTPNATVTSKYWGLAYEIVQAVFDDPVDIACVNCTVSGSANIAGEFGLSFEDGGFLKNGIVTLEGGLTTEFNLGIVGDLDVSYTYSDTVMSVGLPGFSIWNVITVGPILAQKFKLSLDADTRGELFVGTTGGIPSFSATLDFYDPTNSSVAGWDPEFKKTNFTVDGSITGEVVFGLPLSIGIGIDIPVLDFSKQLAVVNDPYINTTVEYAHGVANYTCNDGLDWQIALDDEVSLDIFSVATLSLWKGQTPALVEGCYLLSSANSTQASNSSTRV